MDGYLPLSLWTFYGTKTAQNSSSKFKTKHNLTVLKINSFPSFKLMAKTILIPAKNKMRVNNILGTKTPAI